MEKTSEINTTIKKQDKKKDDRQKLQSLARMDKKIEKKKIYKLAKIFLIFYWQVKLIINYYRKNEKLFK